MESEVDSQATTLGAKILPFWRFPMFTVGTPKEGASKIPLDEFPTTAKASAMSDQ